MASKTYRELKEFLETLNDTQLDKEVLIMGVEVSYGLLDMEVITEDMINPSGDGCEPISAYSDPEYDDYDKTIVAHAGDPWLHLEC